MHSSDVYLDPLRNTAVEQRHLVSGRIFGHLADAETSALVHLAQISHGSVPRTSRCSKGFQKNLIMMGLAVFASTDFPEEHTHIKKNASLIFNALGLHYIDFLRK
jgi:hypothetical protein